MRLDGRGGSTSRLAASVVSIVLIFMSPIPLFDPMMVLLGSSTCSSILGKSGGFLLDAGWAQHHNIHHAPYNMVPCDAIHPTDRQLGFHDHAIA